MKKIKYTKNGEHPDDAISKVKTFINELQKIQEYYYNTLVDNLDIDSESEPWLFDYVHNESQTFNLTFTEYLETYEREM
jgi:hypothetical protein